jgi:hypothetical protein
MVWHLGRTCIHLAHTRCAGIDVRHSPGRALRSGRPDINALPKTASARYRDPSIRPVSVRSRGRRRERLHEGAATINHRVAEATTNLASRDTPHHCTHHGPDKGDRYDTREEFGPG